MGFYVRDLYLDSARFRRFTLTDLIWHDPLTNPPTVPETSPIISIAALSPQIAKFADAVNAGNVGHAAVQDFAGAIGAAALSGYLYPDPDGDPGQVPTPITPIAHRFTAALHESDLVAVRAGLEAAIRLTDSAREQMAPTSKDVDLVRAELEGALKELA